MFWIFYTLRLYVKHHSRASHVVLREEAHISFVLAPPSHKKLIKTISCGPFNWAKNHSLKSLGTDGNANRGDLQHMSKNSVADKFTTLNPKSFN